ncbi:cupredoxin domain-containing protein [Rubrivirga sp. IMCC43871]|uniref:cupredoxin domain-containing protein n=1 Tax=Rubrivirga sp. IMCC43871 TaxID=3391575 RepID=UPI00398FB226
MTRFFLPLVLVATLSACADEAPAPPESPTHPETHETAAADGPVTPEMVDGVQVVAIEAGSLGFQPREIQLEAGVPARFVITRTVDDACSSEITIPSYDVAATPLPLGEAVAISFTPTEAGEVEFVCGMEMQRGTIAVVS